MRVAIEFHAAADPGTHPDGPPFLEKHAAGPGGGAGVERGQEGAESGPAAAGDRENAQPSVVGRAAHVQPQPRGDPWVLQNHEMAGLRKNHRPSVDFHIEIERAGPGDGAQNGKGGTRRVTQVPPPTVGGSRHGRAHADAATAPEPAGGGSVLRFVADGHGIDPARATAQKHRERRGRLHGYAVETTKVRAGSGIQHSHTLSRHRGIGKAGQNRVDGAVAADRHDGVEAGRRAGEVAGVVEAAGGDGFERHARAPQTLPPKRPVPAAPAVSRCRIQHQERVHR